jgi:alpha-D-xyloside xylohydrolase
MTGGKLDDAKNPYAEQKRLEVTDQYMMGPSILVAPVFTGQKERAIVLPIGNWFDFYTGEYAGNGETITIQTKLEEIPLFVKDGGIIPMLTSVDKNSTDQSLGVRLYGSKENTYLLYNDDGVSYDFELDEYSLTELRSTFTQEGQLKGSSTELKNSNYTYGNITWSRMTKPNEK